MALDTNFNVNPYYDDFDEDKKFLRVLFKPGYAVQARELTQLQTILQKQVDRFGNHVFKNGSLVSGGQTFLQDATYIKLDTAYGTTDVDANSFIGMTILSTDDSKRAEVIKAYPADAGTGDPITLMVKQVYGNNFTSLETIKTNETSPYYANISSSGVGTGQIYSINEGVFFYDGFFIKNDAQTIATAKYSNTTANVRIGFEITESVVKSTSDTTLLDPAQDASNYQAPGADRYKIDLVLSTRELDSTDTTQFIEIARVVQGVITRDYKYPIYSVLEDTLARRTYDESGNYTVRPFTISLESNAANSAQTDIIMSPGKAYVFGYEYETTGPTVITVDKPRESSSIVNKRLSSDYGYFVYSNTHYGTLPMNSLQTVDLHCVPRASINTSSTAAISNTKIGTARIKSIEFDSASNTSNSSTYEYRTFLFDVNIGSVTGTVRSANIGNVTIGNTTAGQIFTSVTDAYKGAKLRITTGAGSDEPPKYISSFDATNQLLTLAENFITTPNSSSTFAIDFEFNDAESIVNYSSTTLQGGANIDERSKDYATTYQDAIISDTSLEPLLIQLGQDYVANGSISDMTFSYKRLYSGVSFSSNAASLSVSDIATETMAYGTTTSQILENYQIVCTSASGSYSVGQVISADRVSLTGGGNTTATLTVTNSQSMTANVIATIDVAGQIQKTKTLISPNATVQISNTTGTMTANVDSGAALVYGNDGQTTIANTAVNRTPDSEMSLYVSDVIELIQVLDFAGANVANTGGTDVTEKYTLVTGQKDSYYDHSAIKLKPGYTSPTGPLVVRYKRYQSSATGGFFSVDSYPDYDTIPTYASKANGIKYELRDCLDFRPVRADASGTYTSGTVTFNINSATSGPKIPQNGSQIILDYDYFLPRIDKVVLNKNKTFEVVKGISSLTPLEPKDKDEAMTLYILTNPAYVASTNDINVNYIEHKRFTMRDIGAIEKRVENLEYYTSLSLLEQDTLNKQDMTILDSANLPRFKNGIITDSFKGHSVAAVEAADYIAAIDPVKKELRPSFNISSHLLTFDAANSVNALQSGNFITANSTTTAFIDQSLASKAINVNPFNVISYLGKVTLDPASDVWYDVTHNADVTVNIGGDQDAWDLLLQRSGASATQIEWGPWQTKWTGTPQSQTNRVYEQTFAYGVPRRILETTTTTQDIGQSRTGIASSVTTSRITKSLGDRIVDVSVIPYMRARNVLFVASDFKPDTALYSYFDTTDVTKYVARANKFNLSTNNLGYRTTVGNPEPVNIYNTTTLTTNATAVIVKTSNNSAFVVSMSPTTTFPTTANLVGTVTGTSVAITGYEHYTGTVNTATSNTVTLRIDASGAANETWYANSSNSNIISIVSGTGAGQQATMTAYDATTRTATISGTWATTPDTTSIYTIGKPTSTRAGDVAGIFFIPAGVFRTGEKRFRLIDNSTGDLGSSATNGDAAFYAQGMLQTKEQTVVSTIAPQIQRATVPDERVIPNITTTEPRVVGYWDPLAQTFLISPTNFPQGLFVDNVRVCFKSKDDEVPVTLQLRPAVNGYPSASVIYPYGTVSLTPDKVNVTDSPSMTDSTKYTEFKFDAPIYLLPGEHSFVLLANSKKYEAYIAEIGKLDLVGGQQISEQPYGGSLFLSQNGSTWTADQTSDIMFRMYRRVFDTGTVTAQFLVDVPSSNTVYDLAHLMTSDIVVANTSVTYSFNSEKASGGLTGFKTIIPGQDYEMDDGDGRRVLNPTKGNTSFILKATMATSNPDITPFIDASRMNMFAVENRLNNLELSNTDIALISGGSGYANSSDITVTISGGGGSAAEAAAVVTSNVITSVYLTNPGYGYTGTPTITITPGSGGGSGASATYNGETMKSGGPAITRYITRRVTLADGFDSGDLRVYLTAYKPSGSNIYVYYKMLSKSDPDTFDNKKWQLMTELGNANFVSTNKGDYRELTFAPGVGGTANNSVSYTSGSTGYATFKTFAIKIVITGSDTTDVPKIRDLRTIALPAG